MSDSRKNNETSQSESSKKPRSMLVESFKAQSLILPKEEESGEGAEDVSLYEIEITKRALWNISSDPKKIETWYEKNKELAPGWEITVSPKYNIKGKMSNINQIEISSTTNINKKITIPFPDVSALYKAGKIEWINEYDDLIDKEDLDGIKLKKAILNKIEEEKGKTKNEEKLDILKLIKKELVFEIDQLIELIEKRKKLIAEKNKNNSDIRQKACDEIIKICNLALETAQNDLGEPGHTKKRVFEHLLSIMQCIDPSYVLTSDEKPDKMKFKRNNQSVPDGIADFDKNKIRLQNVSEKTQKIIEKNKKYYASPFVRFLRKIIIAAARGLGISYFKNNTIFYNREERLRIEQGYTEEINKIIIGADEKVKINDPTVLFEPDSQPSTAASLYKNK